MATVAIDAVNNRQRALRLLIELTQRYPMLRIGQIIANAVHANTQRSDADLFHASDARLAERLQSLLESLEGSR